MGWSHSADAGRTLNALEAYARAHFTSSNMVSKTAFLELDNIEHEDGGITGEVMTMAGQSLGNFQIGGNGRIERMPDLDTKAFLAFCEKAPRGEFRAVVYVNTMKAPGTDAGSPSP